MVNKWKEGRPRERAWIDQLQSLIGLSLFETHTGEHDEG